MSRLFLHPKYDRVLRDLQFALEKVHADIQGVLPFPKEMVKERLVRILDGLREAIERSQDSARIANPAPSADVSPGQSTDAPDEGPLGQD